MRKIKNLLAFVLTLVLTNILVSCHNEEKPENVLDEGIVGTWVSQDSKNGFREEITFQSNGKVTLGNPLISGAKVVASVVAQKRRGTVLIFKKSHRKNYRRKNGHRQPITVLRVEEIKH